MDQNKESTGNPWDGIADIATKTVTVVRDTVKDTVKKFTPWEGIDTGHKASGGDVPVSTKPATKQFDIKTYLTHLSSTESNNDPSAKSSTSSATGLYQFTGPTWMEIVNKLDLPYTLNDRKDPDKSEVVVKEFTKRNIEKAKNDLGREPTMTEAYMYHFVGRSAPKLLQAPPEASAADYITPSQAKANKSVFYNKDGSSKTVKEVISKYEGRFK